MEKMEQEDSCCTKSFVNLRYLNVNGERKVSIDYP